MKPRSELEAEYKKLARRADDRLRSIEAKSRRPEYRGIKKYAYSSALKKIEKYGGTKRWGTGKSAMPKTDRELQAKINAINRFLEMPTSTIPGINKIYMKRVKTINEQYGTSFTWESLATFFEFGRFEKLEEILASSDDVFNIMAEIQKGNDDIVNAIKSSNEKTILINKDDKTDDKIIKKNVNKILGETGGRTILRAFLGE